MGLTELPPEVCQLTDLAGLYLNDNQLVELPREIGLLESLTALSVDNNRLVELPREIGKLKELRELHINGNQLTRLPPEIGRLESLSWIRASQNKLTELPPELGQLTRLARLDLASNRLSDDVRSVGQQGAGPLLAYLRELGHDAAPLFEAKVLVTGEGRLGKTSLVRALRGDAPDDYRDQQTTWGVELGELKLDHPEPSQPELRLNTWDFGGQKVYRITHQFFFTGDAIFLLVWKPDLGLEQCRVRAWLEQVRLVAGPSARVILVATHGRENAGRYSATVNLTALPRELADLVVDQIEVDSIERSHIQELKRMLAHHASQLPHVGARFPTKYRKARQRVLAIAEPYISYERLVAECEAEGLNETQAFTVAAVFVSKLGKGIYYGDGARADSGVGEALSDPAGSDSTIAATVVLDAEWVSKALVMIFEDSKTQEGNGLLKHQRLAEIWRDHGRDEEWPKYTRPERKYLLRLLQRMHVSYVPNEAGTESVIAQLVQDARPAELPWTTILPPGQQELRIYCDLAVEATGLIPWLIVSLAPYQLAVEGTAGYAFSWQSGMLVRSPQLGASALIEYGKEKERQLEITVRGPSPQAFFGVLYEAHTQVFRNHFPNLQWRFEVPCPDLGADGGPCQGRFSVERLFRRLRMGKETDECRECDEEFELLNLLAGFKRATPEAPEWSLGSVEERLEGIAREVEEIAFRQSTPTPRLFSIRRARTEEPLPTPARVARVAFEMTLYCEYSGRPLPSYRFEVTRKWFRKLTPLIRICSIVLTGMQIPLGEEALQQIKLLEEVVSKAARELGGAPGPSKVSTGLSSPELVLDADYRQLQQLMEEIGLAPFFQGMAQRRTPGGRWLWVDPQSARELQLHEPRVPNSGLAGQLDGESSRT